MEVWNPNLPPPKMPKKRKYRTRQKAKPKKAERRLKRKFEETSLGNGIKFNAPLEFEMIIAAGGYEPPADLVEAISYSSTNPYFRGIYFRKNLIQYRKNGGCYQNHKAEDKPVELKLARLQRKIEMLR